MKQLQRKPLTLRMLPVLGMLVFLLIAVLIYAHALQQAAIQQSVTILGLLADQKDVTVPVINRFFTESSSETFYGAGLQLLQQSGYGETYRSLLIRPFLLPSVLFVVAIAVLALSFFLFCLLLADRKARESEHIADWLNSEGAQPPAAHFLSPSLFRAVCEMKKNLTLQRELNEKDREKAMQYMENISHQLKTPLTVIRMACERTVLHFPETEGPMETCRVQVDKMADMIQKLLLLGRFDCGRTKMHFEPVPIFDLIETATNDLEPLAAGKQVSFEVAAHNAETWICDRFWMQEAVSNILKNCIEHTQCGIISVSCQSGKFNQIVIRDHGEGIAEGYEEKIFTRYYIGDRANKEGNGLGLSIAAQVVRLHFGSIQARNCMDGGAEFRLSFPQLDRANLYDKKASYFPNVTYL